MRHLLKELGKYFFDISKILLAVAVITPFVKNANISIGALILSIALMAVGSYFAYKGGKDNEWPSYHCRYYNDYRWDSCYYYHKYNAKTYPYR